MNTPVYFVAGKIARYKEQWCKIISDKWIMQTVYGYKVELTENPFQIFVPSHINYFKSGKNTNR